MQDTDKGCQLCPLSVAADEIASSNFKVFELPQYYGIKEIGLKGYACILLVGLGWENRSRYCLRSGLRQTEYSARKLKTKAFRRSRAEH